MQAFEGFRRRFGAVRAESRRELDERQRVLRLLAVRDAFVVLIVLSVLQVVAQLDPLRGYGLVPERASGLAPLYAVACAVFVMLLSLRLRGGGSSSGVAAYRATVAAGSVVAGLLIGWALNFLLAAVGTDAVRADSLIGYVLGLAIAVPICFFLVREKRLPPESPEG